MQGVVGTRRVVPKPGCQEVLPKQGPSPEREEQVHRTGGCSLLKQGGLPSPATAPTRLPVGTAALPLHAPSPTRPTRVRVRLCLGQPSMHALCAPVTHVVHFQLVNVGSATNVTTAQKSPGEVSPLSWRCPVARGFCFNHAKSPHFRPATHTTAPSDPGLGEPGDLPGGVSGGLGETRPACNVGTKTLSDSEWGCRGVRDQCAPARSSIRPQEGSTGIY